MTTVNIYDAKTQLSKLVQRAQKGERIVIAKAGVPVADLVSHVEEKPKVKFGMAKGLKGKDIPDEALEGIDSDIQAMFYGDDANDKA